MKRNLLKITGLSLAAAAAVGLFSAYSSDQNRKSAEREAQQLVSDVPLTEKPPTQAQEEYQYILRISQGQLAVFLKGEETAQMVFDVPIATLPAFDQQQLEEGVYAKDYQQLVSLIEDYIS